ncbi:MAG: putative lipid II flippase FtsW [Acidobacteriota bacterium]
MSRRKTTPVEANDTVTTPSSAGDPWIFGVLVALLLLGVLMVYSSSTAVSLDRHGTPHHFLLKHCAGLVVGLIAMVGLWRLPYRLLDSSAIVHGLWGSCTLMLAFTLTQPEVSGASRWIRWHGLSLQPSELAKIAVILLCAFQLSRRADRLDDPWRGLAPPVLLVGQLAFLVALQPDFGTTAMLVLLLVVACFLAGTPWSLLFKLAGGAVAVLGVYMIQEPYRWVRLRAFVEPSFDPLGANFQLRQALIAIGTGGLVGRSHEGLVGTGFGCSLQKLFFLPEPHTDFVFAVIGEELGLFGTLLVLVLHGTLLLRGLHVAAMAPDLFGGLVAAGSACVIGLQALVNIMVVVGLLPTKGIPLPFLSAGGSSLLVSCMAGGLLLSVSRHVVR